MINRSRTIFIFLCLFFLSITLSHAQTATASKENTSDTTPPEEQKYYDIEIIVFKFNKPINNGEVNLPTPTTVRTTDTLDFFTPENMEKAKALNFSPLLPEEYLLLESAEKITKSSRYTLLTHTGWRQPGLGETESIPVWITGGKIFGKGYSSIDQIMTENNELNKEISENTEIDAIDVIPAAIENLAEEKPEVEEEEKAMAFPKIQENEFYELDGFITIILSRYLHTKTDLVFRKPGDTSSIMMADENRVLTDIDIVEGQLLLNYELNEKRRMRSKRLHYLDNPKFGMLVMITPYEAPIEIETTDIINPVVAPVSITHQASSHSNLDSITLVPF